MCIPVRRPAARLSHRGKKLRLSCPMWRTAMNHSCLGRTEYIDRLDAAVTRRRCLAEDGASSKALPIDRSLRNEPREAATHGTHSSPGFHMEKEVRVPDCDGGPLARDQWVCIINNEGALKKKNEA